MPTLEELEDEEVMAEFVAGVQREMNRLDKGSICWCPCHRSTNISSPGQPLARARMDGILSNAEIDMLFGKDLEAGSHENDKQSLD